MKSLALLLDQARVLIIGPAHRCANGAAMPTDEGNQDGHFFFNHPEREGYFAAERLGARILCYRTLLVDQTVKKKTDLASSTPAPSRQSSPSAKTAGNSVHSDFF